MFYYIAEANEHLCVTGFMIPDVYICKKTILYPGQRLRRIQMNPINYTLDVAAMTVEKLEFLLPCTFNVGIKDDAESILKYAKLLGHTTSSALTELVAGIIHGETRLIAAQMHVEEIFSNRQKFKENIMEHIGSELEHFGLMIYNSNIKDLRDVEGSEYFSYLSMKSREGAINQARVDVAAAKCIGAIGEKEREGEQRKASSKIESDAVRFEQIRAEEMLDARSKLAIEQTEFDVNMLLADITAKKKALMRDTELQIKLEVQRAFVLTEQFRAEKLSKAIVEAETMKTKADAQSYKLKAEADARLYTERKNAEAVDHVFEAQSKGLAQLNDSFHGDNKAIIKYLFLERGVYKDISVQNSAALQGLCPEIAVWDTQGTVTTAIDKKSLVK